MATRHAPAKLRPLSTEGQELARQNIQTVATFLSHHRLTDDLSAPVIKCKKTPRKKCSFMAEEAKKR